jgi:hypothetical protein
MIWTDGPPNSRAAPILANLGLLEFDRGHYAAAEAFARQALETRRRFGGEDTIGAASALIDVAETRLFQKDAAGAEPLLRQALAIRRRKYIDTHPAVIAAEVRLAEILLAAGKASEAEGAMREAMRAANASQFPLLPWQIAEAESALGACLQSLGRDAEAQPFLSRSGPNLRMDPRPAFRKPVIERFRQ